MAEGREKVSYLQAPSPHRGPRKRPRVFPFKLSCANSAQKDRRNVYLRIKPHLGKKEGVSFVALDDNTLVPVNQSGLGARKVSHQFKFTKIFGAKSNQVDVFKQSCHAPLTNFLHGSNCLVFAYGATNAGKTFTIQGNPDKPGIIPRAINLLFNSIKDRVSQIIKFKPDKLNNVLWLHQEDIDKELDLKQSILSFNLDKTVNKTARSASTLSVFSDESQLGSSVSLSDLSVVCPVYQSMKKNLDDEAVELDSDKNSVYSVWVSYAEIYNENIYDLLQPASNRVRKPLVLGENEQKEVYIKGLTDVCVCSGEEAFKVFLYGKHNLHQAATSINHVSSRSHSIFSIKLVNHLNIDCPTFARLSMCTFVDLAGSERAKKTMNAGERMKESQCINTSLHVLGKCLEALRHNQKCKESMGRMLPCRESKLTRLFQRALEGKEVLTMIVNINQDEKLFDETMNVLKFSAIAMELQFDRLDNSSTMCSLRKSRFSLYMEKLSTSFQSSMDSIVECPEDSRYMKLLAYVEELKKKVEEEKEKNKTLEVQVRKETFDNCKKYMTNMEKFYKQRLEEEREAYADYEEVTTNMYRRYLNEYAKRKPEFDSDDEDEDKGSEGEEDYAEKIKFLQNKIEALTGLVESSEDMKSSLATLQLKHSKLQFEHSSLQQELENALKVSKAINSGPDANEAVATELQSQLLEQKAIVKEKTKQLEEMKKLLTEAKLEYDAHFTEHEDFTARNSELEKIIADKDEKIDDLQSQLNICNKKLSEQLLRINSREYEESDLQNKLQTVCEARDEFKFKVTVLEGEVRKLKKENDDLKSQPKKSYQDNEVMALEALVASHEDQIKKFQEKLKVQEETNNELLEEVSILTKSSVCSSQDNYEKEISILQKEIKETAKGRKELMDKVDYKTKECEKLQETLKMAEFALSQEQANTKDMRKICEAENEKIVTELHELKDAMSRLKLEYEQVVKDNQFIQLQNIELEEALRSKEEQLEGFRIRRDAQFESYENMLRQEREHKEREKCEVHKIQNAMRTLTPNKTEQIAQVNKLKDDLKEAYMKISELQKQVNIKGIEKAKTRRGKKLKDENTPQPSEDEIEQIPMPQISIKPDPDSRNLRPRRKKILYTNDDHKEEIDLMRPKSSRRRPL